MNRTSYPDWVKIFGDPNSQIKLHTKQKYKVLSATTSNVVNVQIFKKLINSTGNFEISS